MTAKKFIKLFAMGIVFVVLVTLIMFKVQRRYLIAHPEMTAENQKAKAASSGQPDKYVKAIETMQDLGARCDIRAGLGLDYAAMETDCHQLLKGWLGKDARVKMRGTRDKGITSVTITVNAPGRMQLTYIGSSTIPMDALTEAFVTTAQSYQKLP